MGRVEPLLNKDTKTLVIKNFWWEQKVSITDSLKKGLIDCFLHFLRFTGMENLVINEPNDMQWLIEGIPSKKSKK